MTPCPPFGGNLSDVVIALTKVSDRGGGRCLLRMMAGKVSLGLGFGRRDLAAQGFDGYVTLGFADLDCVPAADESLDLDRNSAFVCSDLLPAAFCTFSRAR
ncbi:hypothetical protein C5B73_01050 [Nocardia cyriacigeorgica]|nr:hypothetical protein C5B73_01050 [Nocardia cyriacigeorgica]